GAVARRRITSGEVAAALAKAGAKDAALEVPLGKADDLYIEVMTGLFTPPMIGGNLLGLRSFEEYRRRLPNHVQVVFVASNGPYDFLGTKHYRESEGKRFDRVRIVQDGDASGGKSGSKDTAQAPQTFGFVHDDYQRLGTGAAGGIRAQQNAGFFALPV